MGRPKPYAQRRVRACHDGSNRQSGVTAALAAAQDAGSISEAERLSRHLTMGANEPAAPASLLQVGGAGRVVGKKSLKLWERLWEPKIATLVNVHEHGRTLALVAMGYNRIGKERSIILADKTAVPVGIPAVEDRHHIDVETRSPERYRHAVGVGLDLIGAEIRERLAQPFRQIVQQFQPVPRRIGGGD